MKAIWLMSLLWATSGWADVEKDAQWKNIRDNINFKQFDVDWGIQYTLGVDRSSLNTRLGAKRFTVGSFLIEWTGKQLRIANEQEPGRAIWSSLEGEAFIIAARGEESVSQRRGSFIVKDDGTKHRCLEQSVDHVQMNDSDELVVSGMLQGNHCKSQYTLTFSAQSSHRLGFAVKVSEKELINRVLLIYQSDAQEGFYGFGEQFSQLNLKGRKVPIFAQEQGHLRGRQPYTFLLNRISAGAAGGWNTTYTAVPQYISTNMRGLFLENYEFALFNLRKEDRVQLRVWSNEVRGQILYGQTPLDLIEAYTEYAGRMEALPRWFHEGAIVGIMGGEEFIRRIWGFLKKRQTPIASFWIQDWVGKRDTGLGIRMWWNWELDRNTYPHWEELVDEFKADGIEVLGYVNPYLTDASSKEGVKTNLFAIAKEKGYLTRWQDGSPAEIDSGGFTGTLIDLTNPEARKRIKQYLKDTLYGLGMKGWMSDFGEALPADTILHSGESALSYHNKYLEEWTRLNREILEESDQLGESVFFVRNSAVRSPGMATLFWAGDQMVTWDRHDGFQSAIAGILSGGFSGMSINHSDIGGLIGMRRQILGFKIDFRRDMELLVRWAEANAFSPIYRTHEGNNPKLNHQFYSSAKTLDAFAYFAKIYAAQVDYREMLFEQAAEKGHPVMRHMFLEFPEDELARQQDYQYMLGSDILVAPVTEPGKTEWSAYLPAGKWVHLWSGKEFQSKGAFQTVAAPIGQPPVFYRTGSPWVDPLLKLIEKIGVKTFEPPQPKKN